jgi:hypothetical protein
VGVQEVRRDRGGTKPAGKYTFFYGKENENHELGTCLFVHKIIISAVNGRQFKRVYRNKNLMVHIDTWNVMTMLMPGKMPETEDQMLKTQLQIIPYY